MNRIFNGLVAGAAGTAVLNFTTYLDMLVRARPSSSVPAETAKRLVEGAGLELAADDEEATQSRRTAAGALLGYGTGMGLGAAYGIAAGMVPRFPAPISGAILGLAATAMADVPSTAVGATDPRTWGMQGWLADLVPHFAYGLVTVVVYRKLTGRHR